MKRVEILKKYVLSLGKGKILDIGCADMPSIRIDNPNLLHKIICDNANKDVTVVGFDLNSDRVELMNSIGFNCIKGDILNIEIADKFDLIIAGEIIEHIYNQEMFVKAICNLLSDHGRALISTPNPSGILSVMGYWLIGSEVNGDGHLLWQSPKTFKRLCAQNNLTVERVYHCDWDYPHFWMTALKILEIFPRLKPTLLFEVRKA